MGCVTVDLQHGAATQTTLRPMLQGIRRHGAAAFVRIPSNDASSAGRCLDAGAEGLICPMINTAGEAHAFATACRYPPVGGLTQMYVAVIVCTQQRHLI